MVVAIIDESEIDCLIAQKMFEFVLPGIKLNFYHKPQDAIHSIRSGNFEGSVILLNLNFPLFDESNFLNELFKMKLDIPVYILSATPKITIENGLSDNYPVQNIFRKPLSKKDILTVARDNNFPTGE